MGALEIIFKKILKKSVPMAIGFSEFSPPIIGQYTYVMFFL